MANAITMQQLTDWVQANQHRTWIKRSLLGFSTPKTMEIKYLRFNLDTRDMKIFHISAKGFAGDFQLDTRDDDEPGNLLDRLEAKLGPIEGKEI